MGIYFNPENEKFHEAVSSKIYVDKTGMISYTNAVVHTMQKYLCKVSGGSSVFWDLR